jgi:hypothetical protein
MSADRWLAAEKPLLPIALGLTIGAVLTVLFLLLSSASIYLNIHSAGEAPAPATQLANAARIRFGGLALVALSATNLVCLTVGLPRAQGRRLRLALVLILVNALLVPILFLIYWLAWPAAALSLTFQSP